MIIFFVDTNIILAEPFRNITKEELKVTHKKLKKKELDTRGFIMNLHILDNEAPEINRYAIEESGSKHQMELPNAAERYVHTFKENFLRVLASADEKFPMPMWDHIIQQVVITLNMILKIKLCPHLSPWTR